MPHPNFLFQKKLHQHTTKNGLLIIKNFTKNIRIKGKIEKQLVALAPQKLKCKRNSP